MSVSLLLDTHALIWWLEDNPKLPAAARDKITDINRQVFISAASIWEMSIKQSMGKLKIPDDLLQMIESTDFSLLSISAQHAWQAGQLPMLHRDPFDRLLVAQAQTEQLLLISQDAAIHAYEVNWLWS